MARLASDVLNGYFKTSTKTVKNIIDKTIIFNSEKETVALDCCAGEGDVIDFISNNYCCRSYAVELDTYRAKKATKKNITKVLNADAIYGIKKNPYWVGLNFLNPPYGLDSNGARLENQFLRTWGGTTAKGGVLLLVINPSSLDNDLVDVLIKQGYKLEVSIIDENNEDYKRFNQFFLVLRRINPRFREKRKKLLSAFENAIEINSLDEGFEKIEVSTGSSPEKFKEYHVPKWKMIGALENSDVLKKFDIELSNQDFLRSSIERPNEGQAALLVASGILDERIVVEIEGRKETIITKGTVTKYQRDVNVCENGEITGVKEIDAYKTEIYALSLTTGEYMKCE